MERQLKPLILKDLQKKMVFLTGPRQVGKTYLAKDMMTSFSRPIYLNYDQVKDAQTVQSQSWPLTADLLVFDEIHKMKNWKNYLKGVFDTRQPDQAILVTGSSRMETFRQTGESLAGRYFHYRLYPFSVKEISSSMSVNERLEKLNLLGGFPEPFLSNSEQEASRWRNQYATDLIREDILDFSQIHEVRAMRLLLELLRSRVGSTLSYKSLAEDLQLSQNTVKKYVSILESLYIVFLITPYHRNIARSILKEPKLYFYDTGMVNGDVGKKLENTCAVCLLKHAHFLYDSQGKHINLHYIRTKEGKEIDFVLTEKDELRQLIEIKMSDDSPSKMLLFIHERFPQAEPIQLVANLRQPKKSGALQIVNAAQWLSSLAA